MKIEISKVTDQRRREALYSVLQRQHHLAGATPVKQHMLLGRLPTQDRLAAGARESMKVSAEDKQAAVYFQSLLELGYLVASADGFAEGEREALALLVEHATGEIVSRSRLLQHFKDLDTTSEFLGRHERLHRVAAEFEDFNAREEAISFAALVAIADGVLEEPEMIVLMELGRCFSFSDEEIVNLAQNVARSIEEALNE
jgi:tellurite resistance protein